MSSLAKVRSVTLRPTAQAALLALGSCLLATDAVAQNPPVTTPTTLPSGGTWVVGSKPGAVDIGKLPASDVGATHQISSNDKNALIRWNSFSIGSDIKLQFSGPAGAGSAFQVVNVVGQSNPSEIMGSLLSEGRIWLINPWGIAFGPKSQVNVGSLVASTLWPDFQRLGSFFDDRRLRLQDVFEGTSYGMRVEGSLTAQTGQLMLLTGWGGIDLAPGSLLDAGKGSVHALTASAVTIDDVLATTLVARSEFPWGWIDQRGSILAPGGRIELRSGVVNQEGIVHAGEQGGAAGSIDMSGSEAVALQGRVEAVGGGGSASGRIAVEAPLLELRDARVLPGAAGAAPGELLLRSGSDLAIADRLPDARAVVRVIDEGGGVSLSTGNALESFVSSSSLAQALQGGAAVKISSSGGNSDFGGRIVWGSDRNAEITRPSTVKVNGAGPASLSLEAGRIVLEDAQLLAADRSLDLRLNAKGDGAAGGRLTLLNSTVDIGGRIVLGADHIRLAESSTLRSGASGDAIVALGATRVQGESPQLAAGNFVSLINDAGPAALQTPQGRWLLYGSDRGDSEILSLGGLAHDATYHGTRFVGSAADPQAPASTPQARGNLLLLSSQPVVSANLDDTPPTRVYDGKLTIDLSGVCCIFDSVLGDRFTGHFSSPDVGAFKPVSLADAAGQVTAFDAAGKPVYGYLATQPQLLWGSVTPRPVSVASASAANKVYDGSTATTVQATLNNLVGAETLTAAGPGSFMSADAGAAKSVSGRVSLADGGNGGKASNYLLGNDGVSATAAITPRPVSLAGASASNKVYDGNAQADARVTLAGVLPGQTLTVSADGRFASADAGLSRPVTGSARIADGPGGRAANYQLQDNRFSTSADILPRPVSVATASAADKVYDAGTATSLRASLTNLVGQETLQATGVGQFASADAGQAKRVTGQVSLADGVDGAKASNYVLTQPQVSTTANITPRPVAVAGVQVADKVYDGTAAARVTGASLSGVLGADAVGLQTGAARFDTPDTGRDKPVAVALNGLSGSAAANYRLDATSASATASIQPATLTYVADPAVRRQGDAARPLTGQVNGFVAGESVATATQGNLVFTPRSGAPGANAVVGVDGGGLSARNYRFQQAPGNDQALVVLAPLPQADAPPQVPVPTRPALQAPRNLTDLVAALLPDSLGVVRFDPLDVAGRHGNSLAAILEARSRYKQAIFATARGILEANPDAADLVPCMTLEQVDTGRCLVTEALQQQHAARKGGLEAQVASGVGPIVLEGPAAPAAIPPRPTAATPVLQAVAAAPALGAAPPLVRVAALPQIQRKLAVVIGTDTYRDARIPRLSGARRDAEGLANVLSSALGYDTALVLDGTREAIVRRLNRLVLQAGPTDSVVIYYAGHGDVVDKTGQGYWIPSDASPDDPRSWLSNNDIGRILGRIPSRQVALISDSCFSGSLVGGPGIAGVGLPSDPQALLQRRAAVVMSSGGNEPVADVGKNGHSVFTWHLMDSLGGLANWRAGNNVFSQVQFAVARALPQRPRYAAVLNGRHEAGTDYLFEQRQYRTAAAP